MNKLIPFINAAVFVFLLLAVPGCDKALTSETTEERKSDDLQTIINQFETELKNDVAKDSIGGSISAAIVHENKIIWSRAFGYADNVNKILADTTTIYRAGSISKSFTAFLMLQLVDEGVIKLTDPIESFFPEIRKVQGYPDSDKITFLQLASHTSGLSREPTLENANTGNLNDWDTKLIAALPTTTLVGRPGAQYNYSNIGYGILGMALSRATRKPFVQLMHERIFTPLQMDQTSFEVPKERLPKLAVGMERGPSGIDTVLPKTEHQGRGYKIPNGGIYSTPNDLARFMINNMGYNSILKTESLAAMQSEHGPQPNKYGLGFMIFHNHEIYLVGHNGQVAGYTSQFAFEKESKFGVLIMRNYNWGVTDLDKASFILLTKLEKLKKSPDNDRQQ
jgi:CubicO group peptidase (beta-lactamase class C family)